MRDKAGASHLPRTYQSLVVVPLIGLLLFSVGYSLAQDREVWLQQGKERLQRYLKLRPNMGVAKNIQLFVGDGMGISTVTATRILIGQNGGGSGEEYSLHFEKMPYTGFAKTYNTNQQTADSAGTATAFLTGVKTRAGLIGVDSRVDKFDCTLLEEASLETVLEWAQQAGKSVGIVTTSRVTHATPAAAYAKVPHREWETDADRMDPMFGGGGINCDGIQDIARQLVENHHTIQVVLGGGRRSFVDSKTLDPAVNKTGKRADGRNLIKQWEALQEEKGESYAYVWNRDQLLEVNDSVDHLFGLFDYSHMAYDAERPTTGIKGQPSLSEMVKKAINILSKNPKGYFLLAEGAKIDMGHHDNLAQLALLEGAAFDKAVKQATDLSSEEDTLTIVTADHSHVFTIGGYPERGHSILGTMTNANVDPWDQPLDGKPITTLSYQNGPGYESTDRTFTDLGQVDSTDLKFRFPAAVPMAYETHGGEDVGLWAQGPMAHLLTGTWEQNYLAHVMAYAACIGPDQSLCAGHAKNAGIRTSPVSLWVIFVAAISIVVIRSRKQLLLLL